MKVVSGKELYDSIGGMSKVMDNLDHISRGQVQCERCHGTGWREPSKETLLRRWIESFRIWLGKRP